MNASSANYFAWILVAVLAVGCGLLLFLDGKNGNNNGNNGGDGGDGGGNGDPPAAAECDEKFDERIHAVFALHDEGKWQEAVRQWELLLDERALCGRQQREAESNLELARGELQVEGPGKWTRAPGDEKAKPEAPAPEQDILDFYPVGRHVRSVAFLNTTGTGVNRRWVLQGRAHFAYQHEVVAETKVLENNGSRILFLAHFPEVSQLRAVAEQEIELVVPSSPILDFVLRKVDELGRASPTYQIAKRISEIVETVDPGLKWTLTNGMKMLNLPIDANQEIDVVSRIERLAGQRLEITYVRDLGIVGIKVVEGTPLSHDDLESLAYNSSLLMDYFIFPSRDKAPGDEWEVRAEDVSGILNLNVDARAEGTLKIRRGPDRKLADEDDVVELQIAGGEVQVEMAAKGRTSSTTMTPGRESVILYSADDLLIREARAEWSMSKMEVSEDHLLFGTRGIQNLTVTSYYEARLAP